MHFKPMADTPLPSSTVTSPACYACLPHLPQVREAARVQGFPDWVEFAGSPALGYKQVGRREGGRRGSGRNNQAALTREQLVQPTA